MPVQKSNKLINNLFKDLNYKEYLSKYQLAKILNLKDNEISNPTKKLEKGIYDL